MGMGGGGGNMGGMMMMQMLQMQAQQQQLAAMQAQQQADYAMNSRKWQEQIQQQFMAATGQTPAAQAAAKLSVMDFIHTSPEGLQNNPDTGKLSLLS